LNRESGNGEHGAPTESRPAPPPEIIRRPSVTRNRDASAGDFRLPSQDARKSSEPVTPHAQNNSLKPRQSVQAEVTQRTDPKVERFLESIENLSCQERTESLTYRERERTRR